MPAMGHGPTIAAEQADATAPTAQAIVRLGAGDDGRAWAFLAGTYGSRIHRLAWRILGSASAADDGVQQVFLQLHRVARQFRPQPGHTEESAIAWLMRLATTTLLQCARTEARRRRREARLQLLPDPLSQTSASEDPRLAQLREALARLPERHRRVVHLRYHAALEADGLAAALGCPAATARVRLHRALHALRAQLVRADPTLAMAAIPALLHLGTPPVCAVLDRLPRPPSPTLSARWGQVPAWLAPSALAAAAVGVALVLSLGRFPHPPPPAPRAEAPVPTPAPVAAISVPPSAWGRLAVTFALKDDPLPVFAEMCRRVLRVHLEIDPAVADITVAPFSLRVRHMALQDSMRWISTLTGLQALPLPTGGWRLRLDPTASGPTWVHPRFANDSLPPLSIDGDPEPALRAALHAAPGWDPAAVARMEVADHRPVHLRLPAVPTGSEEAILVVRAIAGGAVGDLLPQDRVAYQPWTGAWGALPLPQAVAHIAAVSGVPCRIDADSGPWPVVRRAGVERVRVWDLLESMASTARASCSEASDGLVIFRMAHQAWEDAAGQTEDAHHVAYATTRGRWWSYARWCDPAHPQDVRIPLDCQLISVQWAHAPLTQVAHDLAVAVHVRVELPAQLPDLHVFLALPDRTFTEVLILLRAATGLGWTCDDGTLRVTLPPPAAAPAAPPQPTVMPDLAPRPSLGIPGRARVPDEPPAIPSRQ